MRDKKYFYYTVLTTVLIITLLWTIAFHFPPKEDSYNRAYEDKIELLKANSSRNRLILVGGSNIAFGMDSYTLEENLEGDYEVINMGLHAGIGLRAMVKDVKEFARQGDVVVVIPEYNHFAGGYGDEAFWDIASIRGVRISDFGYFGERFVTGCKYSLMKLNGVIGDITDRIKGAVKPEVSFEYNREGFNDKGDFIGHWNIDLGPIELKPKGMKLKIDNSIFSYLKRFNEAMEKKNIKVLYAPPVYHKEAASLDIPYINSIAEKLTSIESTFISEPKEYFYDKQYFFDTVYHLNKAGIDKRMEQLTEDINKNINK